MAQNCLVEELPANNQLAYEVIVNEDESENCRFCLKIVDENKIELTKHLEQQFYNLTGIELPDSSIYSKHICDLCFNGLQYSNFIREKFIQNQEKLQKTAMFDETEIDSKEDQLLETKQEQEQEHFVYEEVEPPQYSEEYVIEEPQVISTTHIEDKFKMFPKKLKPVKEIRTLQINKKRTPSNASKIGCHNNKSPVKTDQQHEKQAFQCDQCEYRTQSKGLLVPHMRVHLSTEFGCSICLKKFCTKMALKAHAELMHSVNQVRQHMCHLCKQTFRKQQSLISHIAEVHKVQRKYTCDFERCGKQFQSKDQLTKHSEDHSNIRNPENICNVCGRSFFSATTLKVHLKIHSNEKFVVAKTFQCKRCNQQFDGLYQLTEHLNTHKEKDLNFYCSQCGIKFSNMTQLQRHVMLTHGDQEIKLNVMNCEVYGCNAQYTTKEAYKKHIFTNHSDLPKRELQRLFNIQNVSVATV